MSVDTADIERELELEAELLKLTQFNRLAYYDPYPFQLRFHNDKSDRKALRAANQIGKSICGCAEDAIHLTGRYPDWWEGTRFDRPVSMVCAGVNNDKTRDLLQKGLFGDPVTRQTSIGTGWVPKDCVGEISLKRGVSDAFMHVKVRHETNGVADGFSTVTFLAYEMGKMSWMGETIDIYHLDEEPPSDILAQAGRGCIASGGIIYMTFTPELGKTEVVRELDKSWSMHRAAWTDVAGGDFDIDVSDGNKKEKVQFREVKTLKGKPGHMTEEKVKSAIKSFLPYEIKMRMKGIPVMGSGLVFVEREEDIMVQPFDMPDEWLRGDAIDFGGLSSTSHPTAWVRAAYDKQNDVIYIYDGFRVVGKEIPEIASRIIMKPYTDTVPTFWPHDGNKTLGQGGPTRQQYAAAGVNMFHTHFTNPPMEGKEEGTGGIQIMPGLTEMSTRLHDGRLKVFSTVTDFFEEYRSYHMRNGKVVDRDDDFISACRYAVMSVRHFVELNHVPITLYGNAQHSGGWMAM